MPRRPIFIAASIVAFLILAGCGFIPVLDRTGILPGPSMGLVARTLPPETLAPLLSEYGDIGTQPCPEGQIWIGVLNIEGTTLDINGCIDTELATSYAQTFGLI